ncbi:tissue factor pathway inhibitor isoform X1 [Tympanuchus pallidicinctus]|uniref:tissue factor pathway inhibitor isoform X1 n=3 Tax=Tympanuchus pallidicinctus TaxID=109042 RepID=UPI002286EFFC|nr:tissue factor pathway inhibitor isoform X1 [Tympanuchus pallidicinctus]XP_052532455.1 tissue factor pathway inhibitor isoform X1 [Tympanuchus pallidicinctus]XP_052532456.1 tissue factor pathway inhibitor isoform X1 [Tympanuchus pallidicinctus]XP_052532457.1 tissue factor pathway inhibitor isoform X1 [Tympanuchus pallidicinctus]XP_052532458.1 tissue factor pathway inhibitor isoform X1 [Tympanuchus pallidicinctus]
MRKMKGRKRGCFLPLTFILLFVCIAGHAADDSEDGEEEDVLGVPLPPLKLGHSDCALKADEGPCKAIHMRFYFNIQSRECEIFEYGGCHGNANNFVTLEECQNKCVVTELPLEVMLAKIKREKPNFCYQEKDPGICRGFFSRYFYNKETKICEIFKYGGCLGNQNNFRSLEECQTTCQGNSNLLSVVPDEEHPDLMNNSSPEEERNQFPGIFVNLLPTTPNEEESHIVNGSYQEEERKRFPSSFEPPPVPSLCMTPMDRGLCRAKETRFFFNYSTRRCRPFTYSGCGGNENNFTSRKSCLRICRKGFLKKKDGRRFIRIKKKKKQSLKTMGEEIIHGRIQL